MENGNQKICSVCGARNSSKDFACKNCGSVFTKSSFSPMGELAVKGSVIGALTSRGKMPGFALFLLFFFGSLIILLGLGGVLDMFKPTGIELDLAPFIFGVVMELIGLSFYYKAIKNIITFRVNKHGSKEDEEVEKEGYEVLADKVEKAMKDKK